MLISALSAPIYAASLAAVALRRKSGFVATPKGDASTRDTLITFRKHVLWALVFGVPLAFSFVLGHHHFSMRAWSFASLVVCLLPVAIWRVELARERRAARRGARAAERVAAPALGAAPVAEPERREEPVPAPVAPDEPVRREHLRPVPDLPREPVREQPLEPAASERRKRHEVVRFDPRTTLTRDRHGAVERDQRPVRCASCGPGRRKNHVVVRFGPPQGHRFGEHPEQESSGRSSTRLRRECARQAAARQGAADPPGRGRSDRDQRSDARVRGQERPARVQDQQPGLQGAQRPLVDPVRAGEACASTRSTRRCCAPARS